MSGGTPVWVKAILLWIVGCLALMRLAVGSRFSPLLRTHTTPALLGVVFRLSAWFCVLLARGHRLQLSVAIAGVTLGGVATFSFRRQLLEIALQSPLTVVIVALAVFLYCVLGSRRYRARKALSLGSE